MPRAYGHGKQKPVKKKTTSEEPAAAEKPKKKAAAAAEGGDKETIKKTIKKTASDSGAFNKEKKRHEHTAVAATGVASATRVAKMVLWDLTTPLPKWAEAVPVDRKLCIAPAAAAALEMDGMTACNKLRHRLGELAQAHKPNMVIRPLTFERWRFGATWEEQSAGSKAGKKAQKATAFPLLPCKPDGSGGPAAQALMDDLQWQGLNEGAAKEVAAALRSEAAAATAKLTTRRQQAVSGKPASLPPLAVTVNRHSLDFACGKRLTKLSLAGYAKLCALHRRHGSQEEAVPPAPPRQGAAESEPDFEEAAAEEAAAEAEAAAAEAAEAICGAGGGLVGARTALHQRVLALLLRYSTLQGSGYQAAIGPPVWRVLRARLGVGFECFASPLNCHLPRYCSAFPDVDAPFGSAGAAPHLALALPNPNPPGPCPRP